MNRKKHWLAVLLLIICGAAPATRPASPIGFVKGYTWGWWGIHGQWAAPKLNVDFRQCRRRRNRQRDKRGG